MQQKAVVFTTKLTVGDCANVFRQTGDSLRGVRGRLLEAAAAVAGNSDLTGYYTPSFSSPFSRIDGVPDFAVGVNILKFNAGAQGNGTHVHMYVDDRDEKREVQLVSKHGLLGARRSSRMVRRFFEAFQGIDAGITVTEGNV